MKKPEPLILCVDDDARYLRSLTRSLAEHGYRIHAFESGRRALDSALKERPAVAVVDIMMPDMDGLELTHHLTHQKYGPIPVVLLTGWPSEEITYRGFFEGARYLIEKPCEPSRILDAVDYFAADLTETERLALKERL
jgi:two-component system sensor histidine kinase ChiS